MNKEKLKIVFFGTPEFAVASLDKILKEGYEVAAVVTVPDRIGGRGNKVIESDVKKFSLEKGLRILQPEKLRDEEFHDTLRKIDADLFIVIAFRMLPAVVWQMPRMGTFNLHASLLPDFRGAAPINHAIMAGRKITGVTTFLINEEIDKGNILLQEEIEISEQDNAGSLHDKLMEIGAQLVITTIKGLEENTLIPKEQKNNMEILPAPKIFKDTCKVPFQKSSSEVDSFIRGLSPYPGAWTNIQLENGKQFEVKIFNAKPYNGNLSLNPGTIKTEKGKIYAGTGSGTIEIMTLQPSGKRRMESQEFLAGYSPVNFI